MIICTICGHTIYDEFESRSRVIELLKSHFYLEHPEIAMADNISEYIEWI